MNVVARIQSCPQKGNALAGSVDSTARRKDRISQTAWSCPAAGRSSGREKIVIAKSDGSSSPNILLCGRRVALRSSAMALAFKPPIAAGHAACLP